MFEQDFFVLAHSHTDTFISINFFALILLNTNYKS